MLVVTIVIGILSFAILYPARFIDRNDELSHYYTLANILRVISILFAFAVCILVGIFAPGTYMWIIVDALYISSFVSAYFAW